MALWKKRQTCWILSRHANTKPRISWITCARWRTADPHSGRMVPVSPGRANCRAMERRERGRMSGDSAERRASGWATWWGVVGIQSTPASAAAAAAAAPRRRLCHVPLTALTDYLVRFFVSSWFAQHCVIGQDSLAGAAPVSAVRYVSVCIVSWSKSLVNGTKITENKKLSYRRETALQPV